MKTKISTVKNQEEKATIHMEALADSGASASILSLNLAKKLKMTKYDKGDATLNDEINKHMYVSGRGKIMMEEKYGFPHRIKVLISKDLGMEELAVGLEDLNENPPQRIPQNNARQEEGSTDK